MKILLHTCCGPCTIFPLQDLREQGHIIEGFFYNPNIHPYQEFQRRLTTLKQYALEESFPLIIRDDYNFEDYIRRVAFHEDERCGHCYMLRLTEIAKQAKKLGYDAFTTTLLVSPYQNHELIKETAENVAREFDIPFIYKDFRPGFRNATDISREKAMYRQPYCGCIYSEKERYYKGSK